MGAKTLLLNTIGLLLIVVFLVACAPQAAATVAPMVTEAPPENIITTVEVVKTMEVPAETESPPPTRPPASGLSPTLEATRAASLAELIQAEFTRMAHGCILYNPSAKMTIGEPVRVEGCKLLGKVFGDKSIIPN